MALTRLDTTQTATIAANASISSVIDLGKSGNLEGITLPSTWTEGSIVFRVSLTEDGEYLKMYDSDGHRVSSCAQANTYVSLSGLITRGMRYIKLESEENQAAERLIQMHIRYEI